MADQKDKHSDPPAEYPTIIPLKKRSMAENSEPDSESSDSRDDKDMIDNFAEQFKKKKLEEIKRKAFYSVLLAFNAEALTIQDKRIQIIEKLRNEWNIAPETCSSYEDHIQKNHIAQQERVDLDVKETEIVEAKPLSISEKKPTLFHTLVTTTPEALVGRRVGLKLPFEDHFEDLVIKEYNAKDGMHRLETADSDELLILMDLREVPPQDIIWRDGENPNFEAPGLAAEK